MAAKTWFQAAYRRMQPHFGSVVPDRYANALAIEILGEWRSVRLEPPRTIVGKLVGAGLMHPIQAVGELRASHYSVAAAEVWDARMAAELLGDEQELL